MRKNKKTLIIAEIGVNHEGNIDTAKQLIVSAARGGAHAAKFQSYKADTLASKQSPAYWDLSQEPTKSQHELFKKYDKIRDEIVKKFLFGNFFAISSLFENIIYFVTKNKIGKF